MFIIVGLGNPGSKYEKTRHNLGFRAVNCLAERLGAPLTRERFEAKIVETRIGTEKVLLVEPQTYMNLSGRSVREVLNFYKETPDHLLVIYDDFDIPLGTLRIRKFGSAGTHNGMRSVVSEIGTDRFPRIRIGTGSGSKGKDLVGFVIGSFSESERKLADETAERAAEAAEVFVTEGIDRAMNRFNTPKKKAEHEE